MQTMAEEENRRVNSKEEPQDHEDTGDTTNSCDSTPEGKEPGDKETYMNQ